MRFFKKFLLFFLFKKLNFLFKFWKLDASNFTKIGTFKYLQKIDESIYNSPNLGISLNINFNKK